MAINLGSSPIAEIKLGSTPAERVFLGTTLVWPFLTTLSGIPPIVMLNALERYVYSLTQTGKCEQNGTPTPSAPKDIMCNNGALKVGRETYTTSLGRTVYGGTLDVVTGELVVDRAMITLNGSEAWIKSSNGNVYYLTLNASTFPYGASVEQYNVCDKYVFKGFASGGYSSFLSNGEYLLYRPSGSSSVVREIAFKNNSITSVADWKTSLQNNPIQVVYELDTPQTYQLTPQTVEMIAEQSTFQSNANGNIDITYYANGILKTVSGSPVVITDADGQNAEDVTVHIEPIQSGSGTPSPTNIRPISGMTDINITRLGGVVVDGTPEVLTVTGKNLFDISAYDKASDWTGTPYKYIAIPLQNGQYTISWDKSKGGGFYWLVQVNGAVKGTSNAGSGGSWLWHDTNPSLQKETFTFTVTEGYVYFSCSFGGYFVQKFLPALETVQIEKGSTATAYEPYSAQTVANIPMLLSVGDYKDEGDLISGTVTRRCGVLVIDGTEGWSLTQTANVYIANNLAANALKSDTTPACLCTHYKGVGPSIGAPGMGALSIKMGYGGEGGSELARNRVYLNDTTAGSADGLINFLKAQYAAGTPVMVIYPLATETTESVTAQPIMAHAGSNTIDISPKNVSGINLEVKYWTS